jgi:hypothetical protein
MLSRRYTYVGDTRYVMVITAISRLGSGLDEVWA